MFRQIKVATSRDLKSQLYLWKEAIIKTYKKLTVLRSELVAFIEKKSKENEFNPFLGHKEFQSGRMQAQSGAPNYRSGNLSPNERSPIIKKNEKAKTTP